MDGFQAHERVINILIRKIFSRELKPGDKLPPERQLAKDIHVDRASLRIALKNMELMNVLTIRHGDGIYVRDYMKGASIDFLRMLFYRRQNRIMNGWSIPISWMKSGNFGFFSFLKVLKLRRRVLHRATLKL